MTHLQTANNYPDMSAIGFIQQFALLNHKAVLVDASHTYTAYSFPIKVAYASGSVPAGVIEPLEPALAAMVFVSIAKVALTAMFEVTLLSVRAALATPSLQDTKW